MVSTAIDIDVVRKKLGARRDTSFARLVDAVSELYALHSVSPDEIRAAVDATIWAEMETVGLQAFSFEPEL
jgi:hypothetical protein